MNPEFPQVFYQLGKIHYKMHNYKESYKQFDILLSKEHNNFKAQTYQGLIIFKIAVVHNHKSEGLIFFKKALENPDITHKFKFIIYQKMAEYYQGINMQKSVLRYQELALQLQPDNLTLANTIVHHYLKKKQYNKAIEVFKRTQKLFPNDLDLCIKLGSLYVCTKNYQKGLKYFSYVVKNQRTHYKANLLLAQLHRDQFQNMKQAQIHFENIEKRD